MRDDGMDYSYRFHPLYEGSRRTSHEDHAEPLFNSLFCSAFVQHLFGTSRIRLSCSSEADLLSAYCQRYSSSCSELISAIRIHLASYSQKPSGKVRSEPLWRSKLEIFLLVHFLLFVDFLSPFIMDRTQSKSINQKKTK